MNNQFLAKRIMPILLTVLLSMALSFAGEKEKNPPQTFLDTINKGKELSITNGDFAPQGQAPAPAVAPASAPSPAAKAPAETTAVISKPEPKAEAGVVPSKFKIQILASTQQDKVKKEKGLLAAKTELPLVISFEAPYYKLFAGDFAQRGEAESTLAQLKTMGYNDAWIVRTAVQKK